jgi:hypothetical protein
MNRLGNGRSTPSGDPLADPSVRAAMQQAWQDSAADDPDRRHEEGGYIVQDDDGSYGAVRWPSGSASRITPPARAVDGTYHGRQVIGEFHTHPNPLVDEQGRLWQEAPSPGDIAGIRGEGYPGDSYVIGHNWMYRIANDGSTSTLGPRADVLALPE